MKYVMSVRQEIADHWHYRNPPVNSVFANDDAFAAFYTSKYLIQDTAEAVNTHMQKGFSPDPMAAYIEFWGVMQALFIQQDAVVELHNSICGTIPTLPASSPWFDLRDLRNRCAGHPANKGAKGGVLRSFMGRNFGSYPRVTFEQYDSVRSAITHPTVDLLTTIQFYDQQAGGVLLTALTELKRKCP